MKQILDSPDGALEPELVALTVNLASNRHNVQVICDKPGLPVLIGQALKTRDSLLFKMIRNMSRCCGAGTKRLFLVSRCRDGDDSTDFLLFLLFVSRLMCIYVAC